MALSPAQIESVREMVGDKTFATVESLCAEMNAAQEAAMVDDIDLWDVVKNKHLIYTGGGVDLNKKRDRRALIRRVRRRLDLPVSDAGSGGIFYIPVGIGFDNSVCD
jgi:hypothetical protein